VEAGTTRNRAAPAGAAAFVLVEEMPDMKVQAILNAKKGGVVTIQPNEPVKRAADRLRIENIAALVVVDREAAVGLISEREIVRGFSLHGDRLSSMSVKDLMIPAVTCSPEEDIKRVMMLMTQNRVRHIPVTRDGRVIGVVSIGDVVKHRLMDL
jgi:CBS domain-containing protein